MTLIVAVGWREGVVVASDSAGTDSTTRVQHLLPKIHCLGKSPIACGASGDVGLIQKVCDELTHFREQGQFRKLRHHLKSLVGRPQKEARESWISQPPPFNVPPAAVLLFAGVHKERCPFILEIEKDNRDTEYGDEFGYFAAIGSGKLLAQALFRPYQETPVLERDEQFAKVTAYRVVQEAVNLSSEGLALPVQMFAITKDAAASAVPKAELQAYSDTCHFWREIERESLGKALSGTRGQKAEPQIPAP